MTSKRKMEVCSNEFVESASVKWESMSEGVKKKIMAYNDQIMLVRVEFEMGATGPIHNHPHVQVTNVESGVFEIEIDRKKKILKSGDAFYVPSNAMHGVVCIEAGVLVDVFAPMRADFLEKK
jgi:quercetin dioxygenase-like cupin family protein